MDWFSNQNNTLSSIFSQNASEIVNEIEWAGDNFLVLGHFNVTIQDYPFHGAYVFHFKSDMAQPFVGDQLLVSDLFFYEWDESDYWGETNKYTATQVVTHIADGNTTALDSLLADDFSKFMCACISSDRYGVCGRFISVSRTLFFLKKKGQGD